MILVENLTPCNFALANLAVKFEFPPQTSPRWLKMENLAVFELKVGQNQVLQTRMENIICGYWA